MTAVERKRAGTPRVRAYRHFVSLGGNCRTAFSLRQAFEVSTSFPFDWWIVPLRAVTAFVAAPSVAQLYDPNNLFRKVNAGLPVRIENKRYDIMLYHEFPTDGMGDVLDDYADRTGEPAARTKHLLDNFFGLAESEGRILFVRNAIWKDPSDPETFAEQVSQLQQVLEERFGNGRFDLLLVNTPPLAPMRGMMQISFNDEGADWTGNGPAWCAALRSVACRERPAAPAD